MRLSVVNPPVIVVPDSAKKTEYITNHGGLAMGGISLNMNMTCVYFDLLSNPDNSVRALRIRISAWDKYLESHHKPKTNNNMVFIVEEFTNDGVLINSIENKYFGSIDEIKPEPNQLFSHFEFEHIANPKTEKIKVSYVVLDFNCDIRLMSEVIYS